MPSLITIRNPGTTQEQNGTISSHNISSTASLAEIKKLLDGVSFNESLTALDAASSSPDRRHEDIRALPLLSLSSGSSGRSRSKSQTKCLQVEEAPLHSVHNEDDPDVTTLGNNTTDEGTSMLIDPDVIAMNIEENRIESLVFHPETTCTSMKLCTSKSLVCDIGDAAPCSANSGQEYHILDSKHERTMLSGSLSDPPSRENRAIIEENRELCRHERRFKQRFENQVTNCIQRFRNQRPTDLVDYRNLSSERKLAEIQRSEKLLARILNGKSRPTSGFEEPNSYCASESPQQHANFTSPNSESKAVYHAAKRVAAATLVNISTTEGVDTTIEFEDANTSMALLSPFELTQPTPQTLTQPTLQTLSRHEEASMKKTANGLRAQETSRRHCSGHDPRSLLQGSTPYDGNLSCAASPTPCASLPIGCDGDFTVSRNSEVGSDFERDSIDSIECVRKDRKCSNSPMLLATPLSTLRISQKRAASRSGKRGADTSRFRQSSDGLLSIDHTDFLLSDEASCQSSLHSDDCSSPRKGILFTASQSPILQEATILQTRDELDMCRSNLNDSICTTDSGKALRVRWNLDTNDSHLHEIPANVSLSENAYFRMQPLQVRKSNPAKKGRNDIRRISEFSDPFEKYRGSEKKKLRAIYEWMVARDAPSDRSITQSKSGMIFSMRLPQTIDTIVKLILKSNVHDPHKLQPSHNVLQGATLLICRTKEDTEQFASALREGTATSVLNHAMLQLTDRTRSKTAARCASFDIVLSTFDAMMSKDVTIHLNSDGHVVRTEEKQDGWLSARLSSSEAENGMRVEKLSVLHMLDWRRILFVDQLGRGSYVAKYGTLRAKAAIALNSISRFVFFPPSEGTKKQWDALSKSDRRSFQSVSAILRVQDIGVDECSIFRNSIDLKNPRSVGRSN